MADGDAERFDGSFSNNYRAIWARTFGRFYLPLPDDAIKAVLGLWAGHKTVVDGLAVGPGSSTRYWWQTLPKVSSSTPTGLTLQVEIRTILAAYIGSAYVGILIGIGIVAAYETWGEAATSKIAPFAREVERVTGRSFDYFLEGMLRDAGLSNEALHEAMHRGRMLSNAKLRAADSRARR